MSNEPKGGANKGANKAAAAGANSGKTKMRTYTRRQVIGKVARTSAAVAAATGAGLWLLNREPSTGPELHTIGDHRVPRPQGAIDIAVANGPDAAANVRQVLAALGGISTFVRPGERVVIKPNVGWNRLPEQAANTNPAVVAEMVRQVVGAGAEEVWVTDVSVNNPERCFARSGIAKAARDAGGQVVLPSKRGFRSVQTDGQLLSQLEVLWPFVEADRVINLPMVKQHSLCAATIAMKNWYGTLGGHRARLHQDIDRSIVDLSNMVKSTLTVVDVTHVLVTNGPSGGSLDDVKRVGVVYAGVDEVALDAYGARFLDLVPGDLGFVTHGAATGRGRSDLENLKIEEV